MSVKDMIRTIESGEYDIIGFDIWNTLLVLPFFNSSDIYSLVGKKLNIDGFENMMSFADVWLKETHNEAAGTVNPRKLFEAAEKLFPSSGFESSQGLEIMEELFVSLSSVRKSIKQLYELSVSSGKKVFLVSDNKLSEDCVKTILEKNGFDAYDKLYLCGTNSASEIKRDFGNSKIFYIYSSYGIKGEAVKSQRLDSPVNMMKKVRILGQLYNNIPDNSDNRFIIAHAANLIFDDPDAKYSGEDYLNGSLDNFSITIFGPLVLAFTKWMLDDCEKNNITDMCYVYRDGYLIEKVHRMMMGFYREMNIRQIYITRALTNILVSNEKNCLNESLCEFLTGTMPRDTFIANRLFIEKDSKEYAEAVRIFEENGIYSADDLLKRPDYFMYSQDLEKYYYSGAQKKLPDTMEYIRSIMDKCHKPAVFDVGYRGSACRILKKYFGIDTLGYHFFAKELLKNANCGLTNVKAPVYLGLSDEQKTNVIQVLTEDLLNSQENSVVGVKKTEDGFELIRDNKNYFSEEIDAIQNETVKFCESFISVFGENIRLLSFDIISIYEYYRRFLEKLSKKDVELISDIKFVDSTFMSPDARNYYKEMYDRVTRVPVAAPVQQNVIIPDEERYSKFRLKTYFWLRDHHILPPFRFVWRLGVRTVNGIKTTYKKAFVEKAEIAAKVNADFEKSIKSVKDNLFYRKAPTIIFCGHNAAFDKGTCSYINKLSKLSQSINTLFISEIPYINDAQLSRKIHCDYKIVGYVPMANCYHKGIDMPMTSEIRSFVNSKPYIRECVLGIRRRFPDMGKNYPEYLVNYLYRYYNRIIDVYTEGNTPVTFVIWNEFTSMHFLLHNICSERNIPVSYFEFGVIPGTLCIEQGGQMGESKVALEADKFKALAVDKNEIKQAAEVVELVKKTGLNRNPQPISNLIEEYKSKMDLSKPVVLYFGQNDFEAGMNPYTDRSAKYHSPAFETSNDAAYAIEKVCIEKGYNFIYKPHPTIMQMYGVSNKFAPSTIIANDVDINELIDICTVSVTILSQAAYVSLIRDKAAVMLGYNQLRGKGCTYECFEKSKLEEVLVNAVSKGYTKEMRKAFIKHVAQLNKYYLFDDLRNNGGRWGQSPNAALELLKTTFVNSPERKSDPDRKIKAAVIATMPANSYSGGRTHAWNIAESLAHYGNEVYFIAENRPVFSSAVMHGSGSSEVRFIKTNDFMPEIEGCDTLDYVIIAPHRSRDESWYFKARAFAVRMNAKIILINYESGNWVNKYLGNQLPDELWRPWRNVCNDGCMVLSSDMESMSYAKQYYLNNPEYTVFDYWYPTVNTTAADDVPDEVKQNQFIAFIRLNDKYKGSYDILEMISEAWRGYKLVLVYGSGTEDELYKQYVERLDKITKKYGVEYEIKSRLTDKEKFTEIKKSKYLLFPSYFEGYGTPPVEAQYCNTLCFAYDLPVLRETAGNGIVFCKYGDALDMKAKIEEHLLCSTDTFDYKQSVYDYANFEVCAEKLNKLFRSYLDKDWRDPKARTH